MNKVLVTGGGGFIGSHTIDLLLEKGLQVIVFDNFSTGKLSNLDLFNSKLEVIQRDIADYPRLLKEMGRCDAVLHLAAIPSVAKSVEDPISTLKVNTLGFLNVLEAAREIHKPIRLVYASSAAVYGSSAQLPCNEATVNEDIASPYALEKADNERYARLYEKLYGIKSLGLRYFNVYGPRQEPKSPYSGVISKFIFQFQNRKPLIIFGDGNQSRDFIHVTDVARANVLALTSDYCGVLNVATGHSETINALISYLEKAVNAEAQIENYPERKGDVMHSYASIEKAQEYLNFKYEISLAEGVKGLIKS